MASLRQIKQFAAQLAEIARDIKYICGDFTAQSVVYGLVLKYLDPSIKINGLIGDSIAPDLIQRVRDTIDQAGITAIKQYYSGRQMDSAIYFYEEFYRAYDPDNAKSRGVHYSPPDVVKCIVNGVNSILKSDFGCTISDSYIFDPCCGMGAFLKHIEDYIIPTPVMLGAELSAVASSLSSQLLKYSEITNSDSLERIELDTNDKPLVILGNPPYSGHSTNPGKLIDLLADYRVGLNERNPKWLQDDYVKFIRMAQHRIDKAGQGIVAFITNHSYLFNPTFRSMRRSLMSTFDSIYVMDLHGNAKKAKKFSNGKTDDNIFPIQMGVAISFFVKSGNKTSSNIYYSEIYGSREEKLKHLSSFDFKNADWTSISPAIPFILFKPHDSRLQEEYHKFPSIIDLFKKSSVGFITSRDAYVIDKDRDNLIIRLEDLRLLTNEEVRNKYPTGALDIEKLRQEIDADRNWKDKIIRILYRPFDYRWAYYSSVAMERPRLPFMRNLMNDNIAIAVGRAGQVTGSDTWDVIFCTDCPADLNIFRRGGATLLPRYIYTDNQQQSNIISQGYDHGLMFNYIYAILHSQIYRKRYSDFLNVDYPRIPLPANEELLNKLSELGEELLHLHLMRDKQNSKFDPMVSTHIGGYPIPQKLIKDKTDHSSNDYNTNLASVTYIIKRTFDLQKKIDQIIEHNYFHENGNFRGDLCQAVEDRFMETII